MSRVDAAAATDRLPWLSDEPQPKPVKRNGNFVLGWAAAAVLAVAGAGFWLGTRSVEEQPAPTSRQTAPATTVLLPQPRPQAPREIRIPAQPQISPTPAPEVRPTAARDVRIVVPRAERPARRVAASPAATEPTTPPLEAPVAAQAPAAAPAPTIVPPTAQFVLPRPWNPRVVPGAAGRLVQVGAFGSTHQAKRGWWFMVRAYPAVAHLPAVVTTTRNSRGRHFYRFQVGTTSQAHSEVLCQRMQRIRLSCAVLGLPWKTRVER